jgi:hypothetical protein
MNSKKWMIGAAALPLLGLVALLTAGRADGGDVSAATVPPPAAPAPFSAARDLSRIAAAAEAATTPAESEAGDWTRLGLRIATERPARFMALNLLASGRIPHGDRRRELISWLRATGDAEVVAILENVLRDLEERRYAAATNDEGTLLRAFADGTAAARREAIETIRPELLAAESVRSALMEIARGAADSALARAAILALSKSADEETTRFLAERLAAAAGTDPETRAAAAGALALRRSDLAARTLAANLADPAEDVVVKRFAAQGLGIQEPNDAVIRALAEAYHGELDFTVRFNAVAGLQSHTGRADVRAELAAIFETDPSDDIRALAMTALAMAGLDFERAIEAGRRDASPKVRQMAASLAALKP